MPPEVYIERGREATPETYIKDLLKEVKGRPFVVGFNGSDQLGPSRTKELLLQVLSHFDKLGGFSIIIDLAKVKMDLPSGKLGKTTSRYIPERRLDDVEDIRTLIREADGIVIATPVYWFDHSSLVQRLLEHCTPLEEHGELEGKVAGIVVTEQEEGGAMVIAKLELVFTQWGMINTPYSGIFTRGEGRDLRWVREDVTNLAPRLMHTIFATKNVDWDAPTVTPNSES